MSLSRFHHAVSTWFAQTLGVPTPCQAQAWPAIQAGRHALIVAPTGSGKTLAAFLAFIDRLVRRAEDGALPPLTRVVYVSPLKALSNDIHDNLQRPLDGIQRLLFEGGSMAAPIEAVVRTGDTPIEARRAMARRHPHILVTTPESLYLLLTSESGRSMLRGTEAVIVDEIHALVGNKRGAHLALSLERLDRLTGRAVQRVGLSATQKPLDRVARFLIGAGRPLEDCAIVDASRSRPFDLAIETPPRALTAVQETAVSRFIHDRMAELIGRHRTTLVFVNTRRLAERVVLALSERLGATAVAAHHGSLSRAQRWSAEQRLKAGQIQAVVATASLELGIDIGDVELVCQVGSPRAISTWLQRVGRANHHAGGVPRGRLFPGTRDDLVECLALLEAVRRGELETLVVPEAPLDVLAQQLVAMVGCEDWDELELFHVVRRAWPWRDLPRERFVALLRMLNDGYSGHRGRRAAYLQRDVMTGCVKARRGARLTALMNGGTIPDAADYPVVVEPQGETIGNIDEHYAIETIPGDIFQLGNHSWKVLRVEQGRLHVEDAGHTPPSIPFWFGDAPGRSHALSEAVSALRRAVAAAIEAGESLEAAADRLVAMGTDRRAALDTVQYLAAARAALGALPDHDTVILERFFDEAGGMHLVIHSPFGTRVNRAWGLALRKRFCRSFNFELQAAATDDAVILSLGTGQSFALDEVPRYLASQTVRDLLVQALLASPLFTTRWRWVCTTSLAVARLRGGKKVPPHIQRMQAEDLVTQVFPDQLACLENIQGDRRIPDHPLVQQAIADCLDEAMDIGMLEAVLRRIEAGEIRVLCRDLTEPSPLAAEILAAKVYAFLDNAPLEERRTRAVQARQFLPSQAAELGRLDPEAIRRVGEEAWPNATTPDEVYDALAVLGPVDPAADPVPGWERAVCQLVEQGRVAVWPVEAGIRWIGCELWPAARAIHALPDGLPWDRLPAELRDARWTREAALVELARRRLGSSGPLTAVELAARLGVAESAATQALLALQTEGYVLRGRHSGGPQEEWCERRLLARIHRLTVNRLRAEIEPVPAEALQRFLLRWQHLHPETRLKGAEALPAVLEQLEGYAAPAALWEAELLSARLEGYEPAWLDALCQSGRIVWARPAARPDAGLLRKTPLLLVPRVRLGDWRDPAPPDAERLPGEALRVAEALRRQGAQFCCELEDETGLLRSRLEQALAALVSAGRAGCDSFQGLRALLVPDQKKRRYPLLADSLASAGRWSLLPARPVEAPDPQTRDARLEHIARALLRRYGVVFRALVTREARLPPWPELLRVYRRLEARGEIRGGRFVAGHGFEQYALPEAITALRQARDAGDDLPIAIHACDPLNLTGLGEGESFPASAAGRLVYVNGKAVAHFQGADWRWLVALDPAQQAEIRQRLQRHAVPAKLRVYG